MTETTPPEIVAAVIERLKAEPSIKALCGNRVYDTDTLHHAGEAFIVVTPDASTPPADMRKPVQSLVGVKCTAADERTCGVLLVAVSTCLSGAVFGPVKPAVKVDTGRRYSRGPSGFHCTDIYGCFHEPLTEPVPMAAKPQSDADRIAALESELAKLRSKQTTPVEEPKTVETPVMTLKAKRKAPSAEPAADQ